MELGLDLWHSARVSNKTLTHLLSKPQRPAHAGYIESVKNLRETLLIQEWDMSQRHLAKRRCVGDGS